MTRRRNARFAPLLAALLLCAASVVRADEMPEDVVFKARIDGTEQRYVLVRPPDFQPDATCDVLIALHGHGSDRWQFVKGAFAESRAARDVAREKKLLYVSPDYRAKTSWMGPKAEADLVQIIAELKERYRIGKVIVSGASMGGSSCLTFAVLHPDLVDAVASMNGTANHLEYQKFQDAIEESFGGSKAEKLQEFKNRSAEYWPEKLTMPVGIAASGKDTVVPPQSVVRLAEVLTAMKRDVRLIYRPEGIHNTSYEDARSILEFAVDAARQRPRSPAAR